MTKPSDASFVSLDRVFYSYSTKPSFLQKVSGRTATSHAVLHNISFSLRQGDHAVVFGLPGAGKSTLLRLLTGVIKPTSGHIMVNGQKPTPASAAGYVSSEETEPHEDTTLEILHQYARTHALTNAPARIGIVTDVLRMGTFLSRPVKHLSFTERLRLNIARAAISDAPLALLDDVADVIDPAEMEYILKELFPQRTTLISTRLPAVAQSLDLPLFLLHKGTIALAGTCEDIARDTECPRIVDVWLEDLRYDTLRTLKGHTGTKEVQLLPTDRFDGQHVRITLHSSRYLPALYDLIVQSDPIRIEELPPSLAEAITRLR